MARLWSKCIFHPTIQFWYEENYTKSFFNFNLGIPYFCPAQNSGFYLIHVSPGFHNLTVLMSHTEDKNPNFTDPYSTFHKLLQELQCPAFSSTPRCPWQDVACAPREVCLCWFHFFLGLHQADDHSMPPCLWIPPSPNVVEATNPCVSKS